MLRGILFGLNMDKQSGRMSIEQIVRLDATAIQLLITNCHSLRSSQRELGVTRKWVGTLRDSSELPH